METFLIYPILEDWVFRLCHKGPSFHLYFLLVQKLASIVVVIIFQGRKSQRLCVRNAYRFCGSVGVLPTCIVLVACLLVSLWNFGSGRDLIFFKEVAYTLDYAKGLGRHCYIARTFAVFPSPLCPQNTGVLLAAKATPLHCSSCQTPHPRLSLSLEIGSSVA